MNEHPHKPVRPLEVQSPNATDIACYCQTNPMKSTPPKASYLRDIDDETSFRQSPIVCMDLNTSNNVHVVTHLGTPNTRGCEDLFGDGNDLITTVNNGTDDIMDMDTKFPDNREDAIEISSPNVSTGDEREVLGHEETDEQRTQRELEESEALARQLMAEEAVASYAMSTEYLRDNADQFSDEDFAALQAAIAEEDPENNLEEGDDEDDDEENDSQELSYDALLRLGERIGDVKEERWALVAREKINQLITLVWTPLMAEGKEENHTAVKCQVCQFPYEEGDELRELPCEHYFHKDCIDSWLETKDTCALCRKSIVLDK